MSTTYPRTDENGRTLWACCESSIGRPCAHERHAAEHLAAWREDPLGIIEDAGDVGGDVQAGPAFERRYIYGPVAGRYLIVTDYAYAADWTDYRDYPAEEDGEERPYVADEMTELLICTDLDDPGGTELDSRYDYGEGSMLGYETVEQATREARRMIGRSGLWMLESYDPTPDLQAGRLRR